MTDPSKETCGDCVNSGTHPFVWENGQPFFACREIPLVVGYLDPCHRHPSGFRARIRP